MSSSTGFWRAGAQQAIQNLISGGATIHLLGGGDTMSYTDTSTEVSNKSDASASVAEADWTINTPTAFSDDADLTVDVEVSFTQ